MWNIANTYSLSYVTSDQIDKDLLIMQLCWLEVWDNTEKSTNRRHTDVL
jgi:hypothetical protein